MQTSIKQFQQNIIETVILHDQSPLPFETSDRASKADIKSVPVRNEKWFIDLVGDHVTVLSLHGFNGTITVFDKEHAQDLHCIAQAADYRFNIAPPVENTPEPFRLFEFNTLKDNSYISKPKEKVSLIDTIVQDELKSLLITIDIHGEDGAFCNMQYDLLGMAFTEFVSSKRFTELDSSRRKDLFEQFQCLNQTLESLAEFHKNQLN